MKEVNIFWFRRDLRLTDNCGLCNALVSGLPVVPIFIFDRAILDQLEDKSDRRVSFIYKTIESLQKHLAGLGSSLEVYYDFPLHAFAHLLEKYKIRTVFTNEDYEPYAKERDSSVAALLKEHGGTLKLFKDQVIFSKNDIVKADGTPYTVFTPYSRQWKATFNSTEHPSFNTKQHLKGFMMQQPREIPSLADMGFRETKTPPIFPDSKPEPGLLKSYKETRDFPAKKTSRLGLHLRFGTISIRDLVRQALDSSETYLNELIWREFYQMILWHFPHVGQGRAFKKEYENIQWRNNEEEFQRWCEGTTGYPIVDAGMRELNQTGFMHNRVRMITASFLTKHLLIDWRWGEAYFAQKLLDFDLASNNGGWQWAAGSGCDAAPYFRIFNPDLQTKKFDPDFEYISKWVPEYAEFSYPRPIVIHEEARKRCLEVYSRSLGKVVN